MGGMAHLCNCKYHFYKEIYVAFLNPPPKKKDSCLLRQKRSTSNVTRMHDDIFDTKMRQE